MKLGNSLPSSSLLDKTSDSGATTDPQLVAGIIEYLLEQNITEISIMESSWVGADTARAFEVCGYNDLADKYGVELINLEGDRVVSKESDGLKIKVFAKPLEVDYLINLPVLKAHCQTKMTCALKNIKGCIPDDEKRRFHSLGLHKPIAALNQIIRPDLIIVDGIVGDLTFEEGGNPVQMNRVLGGRDPVLIDSFVAQLLGLATSEVAYIGHAKRLGLGIAELNGLELENVAVNKGGSKIDNTGYQVETLAQYIIEKEGCSSCYGSLIHALKRLEDKAYRFAENQFKIGQGFKGIELEGIGIGDCTRKAEHNIAGCPPNATDIINGLINIL